MLGLGSMAHLQRWEMRSAMSGAAYIPDAMHVAAGMAGVVDLCLTSVSVSVWYGPCAL